MRCLFHKWTKWGAPEVMAVTGFIGPRLAQYRECTKCGCYQIKSIAPAPSGDARTPTGETHG